MSEPVEQFEHIIPEPRPSSIEERLRKLAAAAPDARRCIELFRFVESLSDGPVYCDSRAQLLIDGPETFEAMGEAIRHAERFIDVETFIFDDGEIGHKFTRALAERAKDGVAVRLIYDSVGSLASEERPFRRLEEAGVALQAFNEIDPTEGGSPLDANVRDHRKLLIVDGRVAFTGGVNIDSPYRRSSQDDHDHDSTELGWRDTHVAIHGPAVRGFQAIFDRNWGDRPDPLGGERGRDTDPGPAGDVMIAGLTAEGSEKERSPIYRTYFKAMDAACERLWITQAYFVPDRPFIRRLTEAAARGVDVRIVVPGVSDSTLVLHASRSHYGKLLRGGVRLFENPGTFIHAKTAVIDGVCSTVGSSNLDPRSFLHNDEVNAVIFGREFGRQMEQQFEQDLAECEEVLLQEWRHRPLMNRIKERICRLLSHWI